MTPFTKIFVPTRNRRLNELVGLLLCVSALLLFLALASYSPLDPSLNSASILTGSHAARNWIGIFGAYLSDIILQFWGVGSFLLPIFMAMLGMRWFRSRAVQTPIAKTLGGIWMLLFVPALLALLPARSASPRPEIPGIQSGAPAPRTGIERMAEEEEDNSAFPPQTSQAASGIEARVKVNDRGDIEHKARTTLPKIAGSYKLPPSSLLHRPDEQQSVHEEEL